MVLFDFAKYLYFCFTNDPWTSIPLVWSISKLMSSSALTFFFVLIQHHVADVFDVGKILGLHEVDDALDELLLDPNEHQTILQNFRWQLEMLDEVINPNF